MYVSCVLVHSNQTCPILWDRPNFSHIKQFIVNNLKITVPIKRNLEIRRAWKCCFYSLNVDALSGHAHLATTTTTRQYHGFNSHI